MSYDSTKDVGVGAIAMVGLPIKSGRQRGCLQGLQGERIYVGWDVHCLHNVIDDGES